MEYSTLPKQNAFHVTERYLIYDRIISNHFGGGMPNTMSGLLGKGSKNIIIKITEYDNFSTLLSTITLTNDVNQNGTLKEQKEVEFRPSAPLDSSIVKYNYQCN